MMLETTSGADERRDVNIINIISTNVMLAKKYVAVFQTQFLHFAISKIRS